MWNRITKKQKASRVRERTRAEEPLNAIPEEWPNGSGVYRQGTAHLKTDTGLLGRIVRRDGNKFGVWRFVSGKYVYIGDFETHTRALGMVSAQKN